MKHAHLVLISLVAITAGACKSDGERSGTAGGDVVAQDPKPAGDARFEDVEWRLVELAGKPALSGVGERKPFVRFDREAGSVRGNSGVNGFFGPYAVDGSKLRIEDLGMTRMASTPELMAQESAFVAALGAARSWGSVADELRLLDGKGAVVARFARADAR